MRFVIQRVLNGSVTVEGNLLGAIHRGYVVLVGISDSDTEQIAKRMIQKLLNLRLFEDSQGKTNLSLKEVDGEILMISQFTLYADCKKGNRPSFVKAGKPEHANQLYEYMIAFCRQEGACVKQGSFGADMKVSLTNDGPFTIILDSEDLTIR